jgi:hypothetical protein
LHLIHERKALIFKFSGGDMFHRASPIMDILI